MTNKDILPVILCGGIGSRLWPSLEQVSQNNFYH